MSYRSSSGYTAVNITIPNDGANHQLLPLIVAKDPMASSRGRYLVVQNDVKVSTDDVLIGAGPNDETGNPTTGALSASNYGVRLAAGDTETFQLNKDEDVNVARFWARTGGTGAVQLNVQIIRG